MQRLKGVSRAAVSHVAKRAVVTYDSTVTNPARIVAAIRRAGYKAHLI